MSVPGRRVGAPGAAAEPSPSAGQSPFSDPASLSAGLVSSERASASYLLSREGGGQVAVVAVGGPPEALDARPGAFTLQLLSRKGFIKMALQHG